MKGETKIRPVKADDRVVPQASVTDLVASGSGLAHGSGFAPSGGGFGSSGSGFAEPSFGAAPFGMPGGRPLHPDAGLQFNEPSIGRGRPGEGYNFGGHRGRAGDLAPGGRAGGFAGPGPSMGLPPKDNQEELDRKAKEAKLEKARKEQEEADQKAKEMKEYHEELLRQKTSTSDMAGEPEEEYFFDENAEGEVFDEEEEETE